MSRIIKSSFVSFSEDKKHIEVINKKNKKIVGNPLEEELIGEEIVSESDDEVAASEDTNASAIQMLDTARDEAEEIVALARQEAESIKKAAYDEGYETGYTEGQQALQAAKEMQESEIAEQFRIIEESKIQLIKESEKEVADIIVSLMESLVGETYISKDAILFIIKKGLEEVEIKNDIVIKISAEDYGHVIEHKDEIESIFSNKVDVEFFRDVELERNACIIETDLGNIDCGLKHRAKGLIDELKLIRESM